MLKKFLIGTFVALAFMMSASFALAAYDFGPTTLKVGSSGDYVKTLQTFMGANADGAFGPMTKAKVMAWQATNGLTADGLFGNMSKAKANEAQSNFPAGCTNATGFSSVTGLACTTVSANTFAPAGCTTASGFSPVTGGACYAVSSTTFPAGCVSAIGFSPTTGASCAGGAGGSTVVTGGAGDLSFDDSTKNVKNVIKEGESDVKVLAYKVTANDSDIAISNVKVWMQNDGTASASSEKLVNYIDEVQIFLGDKEVGKASTSDFSKTSGSWDEFTKSIATSGAVVKEGDSEYLYVVVSATDSIDSDDEAAQWDVLIETLRYTDGTGAIMSADSGDISVTENFGFDPASADDKITFKSSTANPVASTVAVDLTDTTDNILIGAFKLNVDQDSSDITITELPIAITFDNNGSAADFAGDVIDTLYVKIDGGDTEYEADLALADDATTAGGGVATYYVSFDDGDLVINADDTVEVKVYATFAGQEDNYAENTSVVASISGSLADTMSAEGADDLTNDEIYGSFLGKEHTLAIDSAMAKLTSVAWSTAFTSDTATDVYTATFKFTVTAPEDQDVYLPLDTFAFGTLGTAGVMFNDSGAGVITNVSLDSTADDTSVDGYLVVAGEDETFTFTVDVQGDGASHKITITGIEYQLEDVADNNGATFTSEITSGLDSFKTLTKTLYQ